ncbi:MAG: hypothetical protein ACK5LX_13590 [Oscillospiraceae bacterium]
MKIREQEDALFERWCSERGYNSFIADGVICPEQWVEESRKIVFVLKEANAIGETLDWRDLLSDCEQSRNWGTTYNNVAHWAKALLEGGEYNEDISPVERSKWLCRISVVNLKKVAGKGTTIPKELIEYAQNDAQYIWEQLCIYNPDVIVTCGDYLEWLLWEEILIPRQATDDYLKEKPLGHSFKTKFPGKDTFTTVICWRHPSRTHNNRELFEKMVEISQGQYLKGTEI